MRATPLALCCLLLVTPSAWGADSFICQDALGRKIISNTPCPQGTTTLKSPPPQFTTGDQTAPSRQEKSREPKFTTGDQTAPSRQEKSREEDKGNVIIMEMPSSKGTRVDESARIKTHSHNLRQDYTPTDQEHKQLRKWAELMGRGAACGVDTSWQEKDVHRWIDTIFKQPSANRKKFKQELLKLKAYYLSQQVKSHSWRCDTVRKRIKAARWP